MGRFLAALVVLTLAVGAWVLVRTPDGALNDAKQIAEIVFPQKQARTEAQSRPTPETPAAPSFSPAQAADALLTIVYPPGSSGPLEGLLKLPADDIAAGMICLSKGLEKATGGRPQAFALMTYVPTVGEIFPQGKFSAEECARLTSRMEHINGDMISQWQRGMAAACDNEPDRTNAVLEMARSPNLWTESSEVNEPAFKSALARLNGLPREIVQRFAAIAHFSTASAGLAAMVLLRVDALFDDTVLRSAFVTEALDLAEPLFAEKRKSLHLD